MFIQSHVFKSATVPAAVHVFPVGQPVFEETSHSHPAVPVLHDPKFDARGSKSIPPPTIPRAAAPLAVEPHDCTLGKASTTHSLHSNGEADSSQMGVAASQPLWKLPVSKTTMEF